MENITMTSGFATVDAMTDAMTRPRCACPQQVNGRLLADVFGGAQGRIVPTGAPAVARIVVSGPATQLDSTTYKFIDVAYVRSGRPPI